MSVFAVELRLLDKERALVNLQVAIFSARQRLQRLAPLMYADDFQTVYQIFRGSIPMSL